jgi:hypothetical protein
MALSVIVVVSIYKELSDVEKGFGKLKDVLAVRPIYHQVQLRAKAHIFVPPQTWARRTVGLTISAPRSPPTQQAQGLTT